MTQPARIPRFQPTPKRPGDIILGNATRPVVVVPPPPHTRETDG